VALGLNGDIVTNHEASFCCSRLASNTPRGGQIFHGAFYGLTIFWCKTTQTPGDALQNRFGHRHSEKQAAQRDEKRRKTSSLN